MDREPTQQLKIRLPEALKSWLAEQAVKNRRSQSAEIVMRLEQTRHAEQQKARPA